MIYLGPRYTWTNEDIDWANKTGNDQADYRHHLSNYGSNYNYTQAFDAGYYNVGSILDAVNSGKLDPYTAQLYLGSGVKMMDMSPEQEKAFNNLLARYQSKNSLNWQAEQLQTLGLSNSGVLQTGNAPVHQDDGNVAMTKYNARMGMANHFISMAGRMGAAGIHGASLRAVKGAASSAASTLAHSASSAMSHYMSPKEERELMDFFANR